MRDWQFVPWLESQLLEFPNSNNDDRMDCLSQQVEVFERRKPKKTDNQPKPRVIFDPRTWKKITVYK